MGWIRRIATMLAMLVVLGGFLALPASASPGGVAPSPVLTAPLLQPDATSTGPASTHPASTETPHTEVPSTEAPSTAVPSTDTPPTATDPPPTQGPAPATIPAVPSPTTEPRVSIVVLPATGGPPETVPSLSPVILIGIGFATLAAAIGVHRQATRGRTA